MTAPTPTLTARTPDDVLAMVPVVLGFTPTESVVMLTFGARDSFHARVDLPPPDEAEQLLEVLLTPARRHGVARVLLVFYADQAAVAERHTRVLCRGFRAAGIDVVDVLRADGTRWFPLLHGRPGPEDGVPYDVTHHPFVVQSVVAGRVTHESRSTLAASLASDDESVDLVTAALHELPPTACRPAWVRRTVAELASSRERPDDATAARLLLSLRLPDCRDAAWSALERSVAADHVELWRQLVRRAPEGHVGGCAAVLALAAFVAGEGALAWCAVDRAEHASPGHPLARLVADLLGAAVSPQQWEEAMHRARSA